MLLVERLDRDGHHDAIGRRQPRAEPGGRAPAAASSGRRRCSSRIVGGHAAESVSGGQRRPARRSGRARGRHLVGRRRREVEDDLGDAEGLVVVELARRRDARPSGTISRVGGSRPASATASRRRGSASRRPRAADRDPAVGVLGDVVEQLRPGGAADEDGERALHRLRPRPARAEVDVARRGTRPRRPPTGGAWRGGARGPGRGGCL